MRELGGVGVRHGVESVGGTTSVDGLVGRSQPRVEALGSAFVDHGAAYHVAGTSAGHFEHVVVSS